jgi:hypothetical protein
MNGLRRFGVFWYDFIVGDDWRIAVGVVVGLAVTALLAHGAHIRAWWLLPVVVLGGLAVSLWVATRPRRDRAS